jgi:hypothetical protein
LACVEAVSTKSLSLLNHLLQKLGELPSPAGTSIQRIATDPATKTRQRNKERQKGKIIGKD